MAKTSDYLPRGDMAFDEWFRFLVQYVSDKCSKNGAPPQTSGPQWTHIPKTALDTLAGARESWEKAYKLCLAPHARPVTVAKNDTKRDAVKIVRQFVAQYLMFPPVTDADRAAMKLPIHSGTHTPVEAPEKAPVFTVRPLAACLLGVDFWAEGSTGKAKPYGYQGAMVCYAILDHVPSGPEELSDPKVATRTPHKISFRESDRGKKVYIALCWVNHKGDKGPWSMIQMAIVP